MPRQATGNAYQSRGRWYARITITTGSRQSFALPTCENETAADARATVLAGIAADLRTAMAAGHASADLAERLIKRAAAAPEGKPLLAAQKTAEALSRGEKRGPDAAAVTFRDLAEQWLAGDLSREYPDRVRPLKNAASTRSALETHIYAHGFGDLPIASITLDHAEDVMRAVPANREASTRRRIAGVMHRVLGLAAYPKRLIPANPLPKGFVPNVNTNKAKGWLYPAEEARLLACPAVPLCWRIFYGFLNREGPRAGEAIGFDLADADLDLGPIKLDENKTDDPRTWVLGADVMRALRASVALREKKLGRKLRGDEPLLVDDDGHRIGSRKLAEQYRAHLKLAGIDRPELFETTAARRKIRIHDTRGTFVTVALANGKTETWVADRTGHRSSMMINKYRRQARTAAELGLGELAPLDTAIPELAPPGGPDGGKGGGKGSASAAAAPAPSTIQRENKPETHLAASAEGKSEEGKRNPMF